MATNGKPSYVVAMFTHRYQVQFRAELGTIMHGNIRQRRQDNVIGRKDLDE
jgi:hypothetical protein